MLEAALTGFALSATLIVAIGAQNAHVLRQGLRREQVLLVVALCAGIDFALITLGVSGVAQVAALQPRLVQWISWAGAAFLLVYGFGAARRALSGQSLVPSAEASARPARQVAAETLAVTLLNPHVYLDTLLLVGAVGAQQASRSMFIGGAALASVGWFGLLGFGARALTPVFARPASWRVLEALVALTMWAIALSLLFGSG